MYIITKYGNYTEYIHSYQKLHLQTCVLQSNMAVILNMRITIKYGNYIEHAHNHQIWLLLIWTYQI